MIKKLKKGDIVEIVASSSFVDDEDSYSKGIKILKEWGLEINKNNIISRKEGYFAGDDTTRLTELQKAQNSNLIVFARGGWGSARLIEKEPIWGRGWMLGFSDTCSLLLSKYAKRSLGSIHGPMLTNLSKEPDWSLERLHNLLFEGFIKDIQGKPLKKGIAYGEIIVSNLTIASFLIGTNHFPNLKGKIIVFEDINEDLYKIDRMLTYFRLSKKLDGIAGIGFGNFFNNEEYKEIRNSFEELIYERFHDFDIPIVFDLPIGHISGNASIPIGFNAILNGNNGRISINF